MSEIWHHYFLLAHKYGTVIMGFDDVASRFKKVKAKQQADQPEAVDIAEVYAIRAHMLGVLVRDAREASGFSVAELAQAVDASPETVQSWEYGEAVPSLPQVELLAYVLQIPISHFWGGETFAEQRSKRTIDAMEYSIVRSRMIGLMVATLRQQRNMELGPVAEAVGVTPEELQAYEMGDAEIPMTVMVTLASTLGVSLSHFLDGSGRVGEFIEFQQMTELFAKMPDDVREFLAVPSNEAYIRVAMSLAHIPTESLRSLAEGLIDITM